MKKHIKLFATIIAAVSFATLATSCLTPPRKHNQRPAPHKEAPKHPGRH